MTSPSSTSHMKNPMTDLFNIIPVLTGCDPTKTPSNCSCTDPSFGYSNPCTLSSDSSTAPKGNSARTKCYYGKSSTTGIANSTGGGLAQKANKQFTVKPSNTERQPFTNKNNVSQIDTTSAAFPSYPTSLLFCADPGETAGSALPTSDTPELSYTNNKFANWTTSQTGKGNSKNTNLGFA